MTTETTAQMAKRLLRKYGEKKIVKLARKGHDDPASLSPEEIQAVAALAWLRATAQMH